MSATGSLTVTNTPETRLAAAAEALRAATAQLVHVVEETVQQSRAERASAMPHTNTLTLQDRQR